jgi:hypothetical protein
VNQPPPEDDLKDLFVVLDPPPGGLQRLRAGRHVVHHRPLAWLLSGATVAAATAGVLLSLSPATAPGPPPQLVVTPAAAPDLLAGRDVTSLHPAWIGLGRVRPPSEPLLLSSELDGALASRRIPVGDGNVVFYMLDPRGPPPDDGE